MKANELRIGNVVMAKAKFMSKYIVKALSKGELIMFLSGTLDVMPVSLTPEIMLQCGFEEISGEFQHPDNTDFDLMFCCSENGLWCGYNFALVRPDPYESQRVQANPICNPFKYLHQLQNLYFALTGDELNPTP